MSFESATLRPIRLLRALASWLSLAGGMFTALAYWIQPDVLAAFTVWPVWIWVLAGFVLAALGWSRACWQLAVLNGALWLVVALCFWEDLAALCRFQSPSRPAESLRIVSLNCNGGDISTAREVAGFEADIVLLQESPPRTGLAPLVASMTRQKGVGVLGVDTSVIADGNVTEIPTTSQFLRLARVELRNRQTIFVGSVRLPPTPLQDDLWSPECWRIHTADRRLRRSLVERIITNLDTLVPLDVPLILGGDFNTPGKDASLRPLQPRLQDAFRVAGRGWGATLLNEFPLLRIDQVWLSHHFRPLAVMALKTLHSDHRLVVCDVEFADKKDGH